MSEPELDAAVIKATQQALGKFLKKPPLTEKLLRKPPFRYLMDVFNSFIKETGCFEGLYTPEEQLFENISDRHDKTRFLQKMIDATKLTTKLDLKVRTAKIVAGHEAKLTNEFLQAMASVAEQQLEWRSAVQQVLASEAKDNKEAKESKESKTKETKPKEAKTTKISPRGKEEATQRREKRVSPQEQKVQKRSTPPVKDKEKEKSQRRQKASPDAETKTKLSRQSSKQKSPSPVKLGLKQKKQNSTESESKSMESVPSPAPAPVPKPASPVAKPASPAKPEPVAEPPKQPSPELPPPEPESRKSSSRSRRSSASQSRQLPPPAEVEPPKTANDSSEPVTSTPSPTADANNNSSNSNKRERESTFTRENSKESNGSITRPRTSLRPPSARPASARPGAPRRRNVEIVLQPNDQLKMSGINVKLETFGDFDDDGENLVIIEDANAHDIEAGSNSAPDTQPELDAQQGRLVQQILETQKELVQQPTEAGKDDGQQKNSNPATRQSSARQMNDLRDIIQTLTKSVNPLGKLMDFIPEDIDAMQLELTMWRDTYTQSAIELKRELNLTASATEPMKQQLLTIEASIGEYKELIDESRHKILQNNERILKMLMEQ